MNLQTTLVNQQLKNPTVLAAGIMGVTGSSLIRVAKMGAGAVTTKSVGANPRQGHPNPIIVEYKHGFLNAVGLSNPGADNTLDELEYAIRNSAVPVITSIFASKVTEYGEVAEVITKAKPNFIEANISCPNVECEFGKPFGTDPKVAAKVVESIKNSTKIPLIVKLTPNTHNIAQIAKAVEEAGADAISAINTLGPGMVIDLKTAKPILANKRGGVSGPAVKPIAVRCVYDIYEAVQLPIIGIGGITYGEDAVEMMMAGASAVGIGTAVYYQGINVFKKVTDEIIDFMQENGYSKLKELVGKAHGTRKTANS